MNTEMSKELIFDFLLNKSTPLQIKQIEAWIALQSNREQFYKWVEEWELKHFEYNPDTEALLVKYQEFIQQNPHSTPVELLEESDHNQGSLFWSNMNGIIRIAAAVLITMLISAGFLLRDKILYQTYKTNSDQTRSLILEDSSRVTLRPNGMIQLSRWGFALDQRVVYVRGAADFHVTHTIDNKPFVVKTMKGIDVKVLGTEFTVHSLTKQTKVALKNGLVQLFFNVSNKDQNITLKPGEVAVFNNENQVVLSKSLTELIPKRFVFHDTPLSEIAKTLEKAYSISVRIEGKETPNLTLMGSFSTESADEFIEVICELLELSATKNGNVVTFSQVKN